MRWTGHYALDQALPGVAVPVRIYRIPISTWRSICVWGRLSPTLHKSRQHLAARLQQRVADDNLQKPLQPFSPVLNHIVREAVRKDLAGQRRDRDARRLALEYIAEGFELAVAAAHRRALQLKGGDVGAHNNLVGGVHAPADAVGHGIADLRVVW